MKKLLVIFLLLSFISAFSSENIYVYRNDGLFNAFFSSEVDSIKFSNIGVDGREYPDAVTQEFFTADSIYRIPLSVIDSISVFQPEIKYKPNVRIITPEYYPYINACTGMKIDFRNNIPDSLKPKLDEILVCFEENDIFKSGFCGQITKLDKDSSLVAECDSVGFLEVYEQLISLGEYTVESDDSGNDGYKLVARSSEKGEGGFPLDIEIPVKLGSDAINISGTFKLGLRFKVITNISASNKYIEFVVSDRASHALAVSGGKDYFSKQKFKVNAPFCKLKKMIPQLPGFFIGIRITTFEEWGISNKVDFELENYSQNTSSFIWHNGKFAINSGKRTSDMEFSSTFALEGSLWTGLYNRLELSSIGELISVGGNMSLGPYLEADISADLKSALRGESAYDIFKDSKFSGCIKGGITFSFNYKSIAKKTNGKFTSFEEESIPIGEFAPSIEIGKCEYYLFPDFKNIEYKVSGNSVRAKSSARRNLLFPCKIGFSLTDEDNNSDSKYNNDNYWLERSSNTVIDHTFNNLKYNTNYTLQPAVKFAFIDVKASPEKSLSVGISVHTGSAEADYNNATTTCDYSFTDDSQNEADLDAYGVFYSKTETCPDLNSGMISYGKSVGQNSFKNELSGLEEGTTYYYRGFVRKGDQYVYGEPACFTTKSREDPEDEDPNPGGDGDNGTPPVAATIKSLNVTSNSASIKLAYSNIVPGTECGYFLECDPSSSSGGDIQKVDLGTVSGTITVPLTGLTPNTDYYFQAYAKNQYGESAGEEKSFTTLPAALPYAKLIKIYDVTHNSAKVECLYSSLPEEKRGGIEITSNDWSYALYKSITEGKNTFNIINLEPETQYSVCAFADYSGGTVYSNDSVFTTKPREIPDLSGKWTFRQHFLGASVVYPELELIETGSNYAIYSASGFYGVITFHMTVRSDLSASIILSSPYGTKGYFSGSFDEDFTSISGNSYIYDFGPNNWAVEPVEYQDPWSLTR